MTKQPLTVVGHTVRSEALQAATAIACAHKDLVNPGEFALLTADRFAKYLADGTNLRDQIKEEKQILEAEKEEEK